jgi:2-dehydro-3-deoxyphosphogluconate aldolase / (4S)-4-hydroxy-2-oxoglutarate aldolase
MTSFDDLLGGLPLVAILRNVSADEAIRLAGAVWDSGLGVVEVPIQTPSALPVLAAVARAAAHRGQPCGAGTVTTVERVRAAREAGASFTVAPGLDLEVLTACADAGLPHLPGVATATEVQVAMKAGCDWVKVFPAGSLGPDWVRDMHGPFPSLRMVATGGISATNCAAFLNAGAVAVGVGGTVTRPGGLESLLAVLRAR